MSPRSATILASIRKSKLQTAGVLLIIIAYAAIVWHGSAYFAVTWDEGTHNFAGIFVHDLIMDFPGLADKSVSGVMDYALDYYADYKFYQSIYVHPPLYKMITLPFYFIYGVGIFAVRFPTLLLGILGIIVAYKLSMLITPRRRTALLTTFLFASSFVYLKWSCFGTIDIALATFVMLTMYFLLKYEKKKKKRDRYLLGLTAGLTSLLKLTGLFIIPILVIYKASSSGWRSVFSREMLTVYVCVNVFFLPWMVFNMVQPVPYVAHFNYLFGGNVMTMDYWSHTALNLVYFFTLPGLIVIPFALRKQRENRLPLIWLGFALLVFISILEFYGTLQRYSLIILFPAMFIISDYMADRRRIVLAAFILLFALQTALVSMASLEYVPVQEAVDYVYDNSPDGTGVIVTNANQQFLLMAKDRDRRLSAWWFSDEAEFDRLLLGGEMPMKGLGLAMTLPTMSYVIVDSKGENDNEDVRKIKDKGLTEAARFDYVYPFNIPYLNQGGDYSIIIYEV